MSYFRWNLCVAVGLVAADVVLSFRSVVREGLQGSRELPVFHEQAARSPFTLASSKQHMCVCVPDHP
jgi:hypothetical protein